MSCTKNVFTQIKNVLNLMRQNAVAQWTRANYTRHLLYWFRFCGTTFHDPLRPSHQAIEMFTGYSFCYTNANGNQARRIPTTLNNHFIEDKIDWYRPKWVSYSLKGHRTLRPKKPRPKRSFCHILIHQFNKHVYIRNDFLQTIVCLGLLFGHFGGMRSGECTKTQ